MIVGAGMDAALAFPGKSNDGSLLDRRALLDVVRQGLLPAARKASAKDPWIVALIGSLAGLCGYDFVGDAKPTILS